MPMDSYELLPTRSLQYCQIPLSIMPISLASIVSDLPSDDTWGPSTTTETLTNGVPYAPYSKGDKLGRCADWTLGDKDAKGERRQYNRNYRGLLL